MTIALAINSVESIVLASDSATTQGIATPDGKMAVTNIWNTANKVFNLRKGLPIGAMTWGQGSIGNLSISALAKDLRRRLSGEDEAFPAWKIDPNSYTMSDVAERAKEFFHAEKYVQDGHDVLGLVVGGYGAASDYAEWFRLSLTPSGCEGPTELSPAGTAGIMWNGQREAIGRIVNGLSEDLPEALKNLGVPEDQVGPYCRALQQQVSRNLVTPGMPVGETIDLAEFLVDLTIKFVRFAPGPLTVGGPIEIAAMTKHEGFKWIKRKHYYSSELNPTEVLR